MRLVLIALAAIPCLAAAQTQLGSVEAERYCSSYTEAEPEGVQKCVAHLMGPPQSAYHSYEQRCAQIGIRLDSPNWEPCLLQQDALRQQRIHERQMLQAQADESRRQAAIGYVLSQPPAYRAPSAPSTTTCNTYRSGVGIYAGGNIVCRTQ